MHIAINTAGGTPELVEPDDFKAFDILAPGEPDAERLAAATAGIGRADGADHVYVDVVALRALAGSRAQDDEWCRGLDAMLEYARSKGWLDESGAVRAHVEWRS
jgi:hypothetical protein